MTGTTAWLLFGLALWPVVGLAVALAVGRAIALCDLRTRTQSAPDHSTAGAEAAHEPQHDRVQVS